jgi:hypothetical protein
VRRKDACKKKEVWRAALICEHGRQRLLQGDAENNFICGMAGEAGAKELGQPGICGHGKTKGGARGAKEAGVPRQVYSS